MKNNLLPPWTDDLSDGCSVPFFIRPFIRDSPACRECCLEHDQAYYYGGTRIERAAADEKLRLCLSRHMPIWAADAAYRFTRVFGSPYLRRKGVSWAFGGERFCYDE